MKPVRGLPSATDVHVARLWGTGAPRVVLAASAAAAVPLVVLVPQDDELVKTEAAAPGLVAHGGLPCVVRIGQKLRPRALGFCPRANTTAHHVLNQPQWDVRDRRVF